MTRPDGFPVLWFVGASGSGKSDASYWTYATLLEGGLHVARVDTDDLGMCRPAPEAALHTDLVPDARWTIVRLHVDPAVRRARLAEREGARQRDGAWIHRMIASSLRDDEMLDAASFSHHRIDVTGLDRPGVAARVLEVTGWPGHAPSSTPQAPARGSSDRGTPVERQPSA